MFVDVWGCPKTGILRHMALSVVLDLLGDSRAVVSWIVWGWVGEVWGCLGCGLGWPLGVWDNILDHIRSLSLFVSLLTLSGDGMRGELIERTQ